MHSKNKKTVPERGCEGDNSRLLAAKETNEKKKSARICTNNPVSVSSLHLHTHTQCIQKAQHEYVCVCEHVQEVNKKHKKQSKLQYSKKKKRQHFFVVVNNKFSSCAK